MSDRLFAATNISKIQGERIILRNLNLVGEVGTLTLILGANGAGKSTLLRIIAGLARPSSGKISRKEDLRVGYIGHPTFLYPNLTAIQNLAFHAKIQGLKPTEAQLLEQLKKAGLIGFAYERAGAFSRGMAQRLNFCRALMPAPALLLLDEPFTGMDAPSQAAMRMELARRRDSGACIVLVSHNPEHDATLATQVLRLACGSLSAEEKPC